MLIGGHVSTAGGLVNAHARGIEIGASAIQVFNQSPRMWRPTRWKDDDIAEFKELMANGPIESVVIHAVYLINPATKDKEMRKKSLHSLVHAASMGESIDADGVVIHPGSTVGEPHAAAIKRAGAAFKHALEETDRCPILLEDTAGAGNTLGRDFGELAAIIDKAGGSKRLGLCLDSCHLFASGFDVSTPEGLAKVLDDFDAEIGLERLKCLHVNDSQTGLGSNRDRHAPLGTGKLGEEGCATFLSEPRFEDLPVLFEGPGFAGKAPAKEDVDCARKLREQGLKSRA
ncbi:MAG TPA: deoxyribonuclease IV [Thermoleophilaceae bacterium]